ncbi:hypothetical protein L249_5298, partial [Ophiocordyceps polyrhachis-furcata BCC 54312]
GSRKRWQHSIPPPERKRYEAVWASNRGSLLLSVQNSSSSSFSSHSHSHSHSHDEEEESQDFVANIIVRNLWRRSRLPDEELAEVWDLVDRSHRGALSRVEFVECCWVGWMTLMTLMTLITLINPYQPYCLRHGYISYTNVPLNHDKTSFPPPKLYAWTAANIDPSSPPPPPIPSPEPEQGECTSSSPPPIFIIGGGNIGRLFAASLARLPSRPRVTVVLRSRQQLRDYVSSSRGIQLVTPTSSSCPSHDMVAPTSPSISLESWSEIPPPTGPIRQIPDLKTVIVATKVTDAVDATLSLRRYLGPRSVVAMAQNGFCPFWPPQGDEYLARGWGDKTNAPSFMACVVSHGLYADPARPVGTSVHAAVGDVIFGPDYLTRSLLSAPMLNAKAVSPCRLWLSQLEKLVYNSTINPLTALLRCPNGSLVSTPTRSQVVDKVLAETSHILLTFIAHRNPFFSRPPPLAEESADPTLGPDRVSSSSLSSFFSAGNLRASLEAFIPRVASNRSSMLQHVLAGLPTEVRAFNGWLVDRAAELDPAFEPTLHRRLVRLVDMAKPDDAPCDDDMLRPSFSRTIIIIVCLPL